MSNFNGKETFLICKNRLFPNKIDTSSLICPPNLLDNSSTDESNEFKNLGLNSMFLNVRKQSQNDTRPTLNKVWFTNPLVNSTLQEATPASQVANYFYVNETGLSDFTLRDFYNRKSSYGGKIFFPASQVIDIRSFDEKNSIVNLESRSLSFDYDPDGDINGRLEVLKTSDESVLSYESEKGSTAITFSTVLEMGQICANFAYDSVFEDTTNKTLAKNRLVRNGSSSTAIFPIYNKDEFFIARTIDSDARTVDKNIYYIILGSETDVDAIIVPDAFGATDIVIKNSSSRSYPIKTLSGSAITMIFPNQQIKLSYTSSWAFPSNTDNADNSSDWRVIRFSNQDLEIDFDHPLKLIYPNEIDTDEFLDKFIGDSLVAGLDTYQIIDVDSASTITPSVALRIYCYGRKAKTQVALPGQLYFVNAFYLYADFEGQIVKRNQFCFRGGFAEPLTVIERQREDLLKYSWSQRYISIPDVIFIPITSHLITYYLPNLSQPLVEGEAILGKTIDNKKIVFVNLIQSSVTAPNQIVNYSDASTQNLININSLLVYQASASGGVNDQPFWTKLTSGFPSSRQFIRL